MGIRVLGPVAIDGAGQLSPRDRVVLGALVVDRDAVVGAERLADALWGDTPPASWRKVVQSSIVRLRRVLGANAIETMSTGYRLNLGIDDVDAWAFERLLDRASAFARYGEDDRAAFALDHALALWRGEPLADLEDWPPAAAEAVRLQELRRLGEERRAETLLARAEHERLIPIARSLLVDDRFRERRWELLALALYRAGRQAEALRVLADARRLLRDELGIEPRKELLELEQQILDQDRSIAAPVLAERAPSERCPYKGLESYDIDDVGWFFGREAIVEACSARVAGCGSLVIAGASGSGKSSVVRAGVIPRLRDDGCAVALMTPGPNPLMSLAAAIAATGPDVALVIDQAEELFSVCTDAAVRAEFCSAIAAHAERRPVVLVLRADHLGATTGHPELLHLVETSLQLLGPMNDEELRTAIERPARLSGCRLEPGLVDLLVRDVLDQPGALPLLSHALVETWARREANVLTVTGYREAGGVHGAVAKTAEQLYQALPASERPLVRAVLLRLVATDDTGDVVRHRLPMTALTDAPDQRVVVEALLAARLVTVGAEVLEISHEALARAWPRLQRWLEEDREGQRIRQHLSAAADGWEQRDRDPSELYRGARLRVALEWSQASSETLTRHERAFLDASNEREHLEEAELRTRAEAQARANRRLWRSLGAVAVLLVLALVASAIATQQVSQASNERDRARRASREAATHNLVSQSLQLRGTNRDLAALLAVAAHRLSPSVESRSALLSTFTREPGFMGYLPRGDAEYRGGAFLRGSHRLVILDANGKLRILDTDGLTEVATVPVASHTAHDARLAVSPDGGTIVVVSGSPGSGRANEGTFPLSELRPPPGEIRVLDTATFDMRYAPIRMQFEPHSVAFSPDGALFAVASEGNHVEVRNTSTGALLSTVSIASDPARAQVGFDPLAGFELYDAPGIAFATPDRLVVSTPAGVLRVVAARSGSTISEMPHAPDLASRVLRVTADGRFAITSGALGTMRWDLTAMRPAWPEPVQRHCGGLALLEARALVLCGEDFGRTVALDLDTGQLRTERFDLQDDRVEDLAVSDDGRVLAAIGSHTASAAVWHLDGTGPITHELGSGPQAALGYDPSGKYLLVSDVLDSTPTPTPGSFDLRVIDAATGATVDDLDGVLSAVWAGDHSRLAAVFADGTGGIYDVERHHRDANAPVALDISPVSAVADAAHSRLITWDDRGRVRSFGSNGTPTAPSFDLPNPIYTLGVSPDGKTLVTVFVDYGLVAFDIATGEQVAGPVADYVNMAMSPSGDVVANTSDGRLARFDARTLTSRGERLPSALGHIAALRFNGLGRLLLLTTGDRSFRLVEWGAQTTLGDPIPSPSSLPLNRLFADLRPDNRALALPSDDGVVIWDLDPEVWAERACALAGRDLSEEEWDRYLSGFGARREVCATSP